MLFSINDKEILTKVYKYELFRSNEQLRIDVHEIIAGKTNHKFCAVPNLFREDRKAKKDYFGFGDSEKEALQDCLEKIKDLPIQVIIPYDT